MAYDKNKGRGAGTPSFYKTVGQKREHGENTGEWTRDDRTRHGSGKKFDGEDKPRKSFDKPYGGKPERAEGQYGKPAYKEGKEGGENRQYGKPAPRPENRQYGRPAKPDGQARREYGRPAKPQPDFRREAPAKPQPEFRRETPETMGREGFEYMRSERPAAPRRNNFAPRPQGRGTRDMSRTSERPIYQNAFATESNSMAPAAPVASAAPETHDDEIDALENVIVGRNPIREAVKSGRELERILVQRGELSGSAREIIAKARERKIVVQEVDKARLDAIYPSHQGMIAYASAGNYSSVEEILAYAEEKNEPPFIIVLDGITDPHNLGAIIRTAECVGAHGVILQQRRSVGLTPSAVKAAAGAAEYMKVAKVVNITRTLSELKEKNIWVMGADMNGQPLKDTDMSGAVALVIGAEGEGISRLVKDECDLIVSLPMRGQIQSLNASVAAGVLMYAVRAARGE